MNIYLAGPMAKTTCRGDIAPWRRAIIEEALQVRPELSWLTPEWEGCDHMGIWLSETVKRDLDLLSKADGCLVVVDEEGWHRSGTLVELGYAAGRGIPVWFIVHEAAHTPQGLYSDNGHQASDAKRFYRHVLCTNHSCSCVWNNEQPGLLWFPALVASDWQLYSDPATLPMLAMGIIP
jgi:nucleoside 2-deoxyribosyltransferase